MLRYLTHRLLEAALVLLGMSLLIYVLLGLMPGDPIDLMASGDPNVTSEDIARLKAVHGLDQPLYKRYWHWFQDAVQADFGYSRTHARPVLDVLLPRLGNTCLLMGISLLLAFVLALPAGVLAALKPRSWYDYTLNLFAFAGISMPSFWLALLLILLFAVELGWLPAGGVQTVGVDRFGDRVAHLVLPVLTLTVLTAGGLLRFIRAAMIEALRQDYIRTARAKGLGPVRRGGRARAAQRHDSRGDRPGPQFRGPVLGRADRRDHVRVPGHGQADLRFDSGQRLQRRAGRASVRDVAHAGEQSRGGRGVRLAGPADLL